MRVSVEELAVIRELARKYRDIAALDKQSEHIGRARRINDLEPGLRPVVLIDEIPWHEMDIGGELACVCSDPFAREVETFLRRNLFSWKHFPADMVVLPYYPLRKTIHYSGIGLEVRETVLSVDGANDIVSHEYIDQLSSEADLEKLHEPVISADPLQDARNAEAVNELLGGILPVRLTGTYLYYMPWDRISELRGVGPLLMELMDRPEFTHAIIEKFTQIGLSELRQYEELGLLDAGLPLIHCTPAYTSDLPKPGLDGARVRARDMWIRGAAQIFASVSPGMHEEFELQYAKRLFEKSGLVYYGCCEQLDNKIRLLRKIPNMRKIGASPWADVDRCADQMGGDYVLSRKPNPANVAVSTNPDVVRSEVEQTVQACLRNNTPYEFVLKDISTVSYRPENLIVWERTVRETLDRYYK